MASIAESEIRESIRDILRNADLSALSSKTVRKQLEEKFHMDLTARKQEIDDILMSLIDQMEDAKQEPRSDGDDGSDGGGQEDNDEGTSNGKSSASSHAYSSKNGSASMVTSSSSLAKRKRGRSSSSGTNSDSDAGVEDNSFVKTKSKKKQRGSGIQTKGSDDSSGDDGVDDEALARKLQQQELRMRPRSTKQKVERKPKSNSSEGSGRKKGNSLYSQECVLSQELATVMGTDRLARKDVVSRMWKIFKERDLMDPKNKQYVICDEQLEKVFKVKKFKAFSMMKILKTHIKDAKLIQQP